MKQVICQYCNKPAKFVDSSVVKLVMQFWEGDAYER